MHFLKLGLGSALTFLHLTGIHATISYGNASSTITSPPVGLSTSSVSINLTEAAIAWSYLYGGIADSSLRLVCESHIQESEEIYYRTAKLTTASRFITENQIGCTACQTTPGVPLVHTTISETFTFTKAYTPIAQPPCCSSCSILAENVQIRYWPTPAPTPAMTQLVQDGFTYVSPSVYVVFQSMGAYDLCGTVGAYYTNVTLSFGPDELSTYVGDSAAYEASDIATSSLNFADLSSNCTSSYARAGGVYTVSGTSTIYYSSFAGDQCLPWLVAPSQVLKVDPAWYTCTGAVGGFYDPPYALTKVPALDSPLQGPTSTPASPQPASIPSGIPQITSVLTSAPSTRVASSSAPAITVSPGSLPGSDLPQTSNYPVDPPAGIDPPASTNGLTSLPVNSESVSDPPAATAIPISPISIPVPAVLTIGDQTITANPTGFNIAGTTVLPGAPAISISGTLISLGSSGLVVHATTDSTGRVSPPTTILFPLSPAPALPTPEVLTIGGQTVTVVAGGFPVSGITLTPDAAGVTISGTLVSLGSSGALVVGTSTINLPVSPASTSPGQLGGLIFSAFNPVEPSPTTGSFADVQTSTVTPFLGAGARISGQKLGGVMITAIITAILLSRP